MSPLHILILILIVLYKLYEFLTCVPKNLPPRVPRLPVVGSYWHLLWGNYNYPHKTIPYYVEKLKSTIISLYLGDHLTVVVNDYKTIKEILSREEFDGRPTDVPILKDRGFGKKLGIFFTEGPQWHEQRRFTLRHMRDFGFGRRQEKFERNVMDEVSLLVDMMKEGPINDSEKTYLKNGYARFPDILYPVAANNIWLIMFGDKFDRSEHHKLKFLCESAMMFQRASDTTGGAIFQRPFLKYFGNMFGYKNVIKGHYRMVDFVKVYLKKQKQTHQSDNERGLVDRYLEEMQKHADGSYFTEEQLIVTLVDFMFPAFSAIPTVLTHGIKAAMYHPEVVTKIQEEIDREVGTGRHVTWEDRKNLPYTEATIREILRWETLTPFSVFHKALKDTTLSGYDIPKNTLVVTNLHGLNQDPELWGDPKNFRPDRFLNDNGELLKDYSFPFGFGHRVCAGETYSRYSLFGLFTVLMQNFNFSFVKGEPAGLEDKLPGLIVSPKEVWLRVESRR